LASFSEHRGQPHAAWLSGVRVLMTAQDLHYLILGCQFQFLQAFNFQFFCGGEVMFVAEVFELVFVAQVLSVNGS
jgi:hypothetical protein